jgi:Cof subfamily protein (haloacid dehalogenase superfamily)
MVYRNNDYNRRKEMDKKILFFDIDGTILSHRSYTLSASTRNAIKQAQSNGHLAVINTGRVISFIDKEILSLGFDGYICGCGTYISYRDKLLHHTAIAPDIIRNLIKNLRELDIPAVLEGAKAVYYDFTSNSPVTKRLLEFQQKHQFSAGSWDDPDISFDKFCIWPDTLEKEQLIHDYYKDIFDFIDRNNHLYEVVPKGYSKASGIEYLIQQLGIPYENTYAFGDGENDLSMLTYAKHSIAMGNAPQSIKDIVTFVTEDVDQDGIEHAMVHFGLI